MKKNIETIIFDLNGTLLNTKEMLIETRHNLYNRLVSAFGKHETEILNDFRDFLNGNSMNPDILDNIKILKAFPEKKALLKTVFKEDMEKHLKCSNGAIDFLKKSAQAGIKIVLWSNSRTPFVKDLVIRSGIDSYIHSIYCVERKPQISSSLDNLLIKNFLYELPHDRKKPSEKSLNFIIENEGLRKSDVVLVGNGIDSDGLSANAAEIDFILTSWGNISETDQRKLDYLIKSPQQSLRDSQKIKKIKKAAKSKVKPLAKINSFDEIFSLMTLK